MKRIEEKEKRKMERKHRLLASLSVNIILVLLEANMAYHLLFHCGESFDFSVLRYYNYYWLSSRFVDMVVPPHAAVTRP